MATIFRALLCALLLLACNTLSAQEQAAAENDATGKQFYVELGGGGVLFSANYDSRFAKSQLGFGYRIGLGFGITTVETNSYDYYGYSYDYETKSYATFPIGLNYVFGKQKSAHAFEVGAGLSVLTRKVDLYNYTNDPNNAGHVIGYMTFMYRLQPLDGGFTWRIGFTPIIGTAGDIYPSATIGIGYDF